jgi:eukaryotic-like serine/threonine-protein kinase
MVSAVMWSVPGYVVEELLGYGGSGEVWRGHATATGAPVALKRLPVDDAAQLQAARAEAALLSALDHPHLIRMHELVPVESGVVLVLDLAAGGSLADLIARRGRLTPGEVITALSPIGAALAYAHNEGVVHGDITPANVLFTDVGLPLLGDLGVARIVGDMAPARSTPAYVDPSVAAGGAPGAASDVFMLAAVAVHALTGTPVWIGVTPEATIARATSRDIGDLPARLGQLPPDLAALLERALSIEPYLRCTAAEFALDLRHTGAPAPVELAAGRPHSVVGHPEAAAAPEAAGVALVADPGRPSFSRPGHDVPMSSPTQLTHGVRAALNAPVPRRPRRVAEMLGHPAIRVAALSVVLLLLGGAALQWTLRSHPAARPHPEATTSRQAGEALTALRELDRIREQAFARREVALLARVYVGGPLLAQDTTLLRRVVPAGCRLIGVHTTYSVMRVSSVADRLVLAVTATLAPSTLRCHDRASGSAAGETPTRLRIELVRQPDGYRIASQQHLA